MYNSLHELFHFWAYIESLHRYLQYAWIHIILLRRLWYVTSNFSNWPTVKFQFWRVREPAADKTIQKLDSGFKVNLRVLKEVDYGRKFCVCHLDMVINFNDSVLDSNWEIYEPRYFNSVEFWWGTLRRLIIVSTS